MADRLRRTGWLLVGCAGLLALTLIFLGAAVIAACGGLLCLLAASIASRAERRAAPVDLLPVPAETR